MPSLPPSQHRVPRGPVGDLHMAAGTGSAEHVQDLLSSASIIDQGSPQGFTPLFFAAEKGFSGVVRILLDGGASVSIVGENGVTALHMSTQNGHLMATIDLVRAGADIEAKRDNGATPLHMAVQNGHLEVTTALINGGANVDSRLADGRTPLALAARFGSLGAVRELLRAKANPLLSTTESWGGEVVPLDTAAAAGHSGVVRELIQERGLGGCTSPRGGNSTLAAAAIGQHVDIMDILTSAGVVDDMRALYHATARGREASVKFLLKQQQKRSGSVFGYVNNPDAQGVTPLSGIFDGAFAGFRCSPRVLRLLINAHVDTTSVVRLPIRESAGHKGTPLALVNRCLREKKEGGKAATKEQLGGLEGVRRLLLQVNAVHATSWLWGKGAPYIGRPVQQAGRTATTAAVTGTSLAAMLPVLRLRARRHGVLVAPLLRLVLRNAPCVKRLSWVLYLACITRLVLASCRRQAAVPLL